MNIYIMRHGITRYNELGITQGRTNNRLSKAGIELVQKVALETKEIPFDVIYSSPLMRTVQTANIINFYHKVKIVKDERLTEIDQGIFTGRKYSSLTEQEKILKKTRASGTQMEPSSKVYERAREFLVELKNNCTHNNVLIVTHNHVATCLEIFIKTGATKYENVEIISDFKNAQIKKFAI